MGEKNMIHYLSDIKDKCDSIVASSVALSVEDIIFIYLNGLPSTYQALKIAIRTNLQLMRLYDFYVLLYCED